MPAQRRLVPGLLQGPPGAVPPCHHPEGQDHVQHGDPRKGHGHEVHRHEEGRAQGQRAVPSSHAEAQHEGQGNHQCSAQKAGNPPLRRIGDLVGRPQPGVQPVGQQHSGRNLDLAQRRVDRIRVWPSRQIVLGRLHVVDFVEILLGGKTQIPSTQAKGKQGDQQEQESVSEIQ